MTLPSLVARSGALGQGMGGLARLSLKLIADRVAARWIRGRGLGKPEMPLF